jgi:hypothetical protein
MPKYEYQIIHQQATRIDHLTRQLNSAVQDGWDPVSMTGDGFVYIMLRRPYDPDAPAPEAARTKASRG